MKKVLVILAHPDPTSFNAAIAHRCVTRLEENGYEVILHDLYREGFDPILRDPEIPEDGKIDPIIDAHCRELSEACGVVIVHPNWWGMPPAILAGWVDRVIRPGVAYRFVEDDSGEGIPVGLLAGKTALIFNTANTPPEREQSVFGDPLQRLWKSCVFELCGVTDFYRKMFTVVVTSSRETRGRWLGEVEETIDRFFTKEPS